MSGSERNFREELEWNSYFVENIHGHIREEVEFVADQYEEDTYRELSKEIDGIVEEIVDNGLSSLTNNEDNN